MSSTNESQMMFVMLALPALFGLSLVGEGINKISHYEPGWGKVALGTLFLVVVAFGFFYIRGIRD